MRGKGREGRGEQEGGKGVRRRKFQCSGLATYVKPSLMLVLFC